MTRTVVVTGASRGIGRRLAEMLADDGHTVVAACRDPSVWQEGPVVPLALDTTDPESCSSFADAVAEAVDHVDVLVNNAGIKQAPGYAWEASAGPIEQIDPAAVAAIIGTNVIGTISVTRALRPMLRTGSIVMNISSQLGSLEAGVEVDYAYNASKAALNMVTVTMQRDLGPSGVSAVSINPGWIRTSMGGDEAPLDLDDAVRDLASLVGRIDESYGGRFVDRCGEPMPW